MKFGEYVKALRTIRGFGQKELAERANVASPYLNKIEKNKVQPPSEDILIRLALALNKDPYEMIVKAGKVPTDFQQVILNDTDAFNYLKKKSSATAAANEGRK
ncbi:helix-turn-helix domain-containing protein [Paenibacillus naphthalenovorans]|uniref:helix-turn-helix domain-containing protein n=1 Tax=Paenibacillus naphthalenovorans TaxID=162209 RepID=UPI003D2E2403